MKLCKKMTKLNLKNFLKKEILKIDSMNGSQLQKIYNYPIYPRDLKIYSDKGFVNIGDVNSGGSHWCAFHVKNIKSFYFDSFGGQPDKFLLNQLPKPILHHFYKIQDNNSKLCGSYCLYSF